MEEAFEHAGYALFETMLYPERVSLRISENIEVEGHDEKELLFNWLEDLLLEFEIKQIALARFSVDQIAGSGKRLVLRGKCEGEHYNRQKHGGKTEVKGVTYHDMVIEKKARRVTLTFVLDL
jgi:SHS2 domain-containing protein